MGFNGTNEDCSYRNITAKEWANRTLHLEEELKDIKDQLNIYKPLLLRYLKDKKNI